MDAPSRGAALVTGAGARLGRAMAIGLARAGYDITIHYRRSDEGAQAAREDVERAGRRAALVRADLSVERDVASLVAAACDALGPLSLLVNSASVFEDDRIDTMTRESWDLHLETNLRAPVKLAQDFAAQADPAQDSLIVNLLDQRVAKPTPHFLSYAASKGALYAMTAPLAQALGPRGIRVNAIAPGPTLRNARQSDEDWRLQNEATVLGRGAEPDDIVAALIYLAGATAVTGQTLFVDGGQRLAWRTVDALVKE